MATRRIDSYQFDHGAQYFTVKTSAFEQFIAPMFNANIIQPWAARFIVIENEQIVLERQWQRKRPHYVAVPTMTAVAKYLGAKFVINKNQRIQTINKIQQQWQLLNSQSEALGTYDWVLVAIPAQQACALIPQDCQFYADLCNVRQQACFALMLGFATPLSLTFDAAHVHDDIISWISLNHTKPGRPNAYSLVINTTNAWADKHWHDDEATVCETLCQRASELVGHDLSCAAVKSFQRWRYANSHNTGNPAYYIDTHLKLAVCGDAYGQGRIETAFSSALALCKALKRDNVTS